MIERVISPAPANTFSDTDNIYALKAHAAEVMSGKNADSFAPGATATRQDLAAAIFNALQYVKKNSSIRYTVYTPDLQKFTDKTQIAMWALEAMAFTHKLGIIEQVTNTTIEPLKACSIEEAVVAVHRGFYADEIGLYQCIGPKIMDTTAPAWVYSVDIHTTYAQPIESAFTIGTYTNGDRVWVDKPWIGRCRKKIKLENAWVSFIDNDSGTRVYAKGHTFLPIKEL